MKIALISCVKSKRTGRFEAKNMYTSTLFRYAWQYTNRHFDRVYILSAKHGLLRPDTRIRNYDVTLKTMSKDQRVRWSQKVAQQIRQETAKRDEIYFFCGRRYREHVIELLQQRTCVTPLAGLGLGKQLQWYKNRS